MSEGQEKNQDDGGFCRPSSWYQSGAMAGTPTPPTSR